MGRRAIEMKIIENAKCRERAFKKRRDNLLKKAGELSILCDSKILVIIFELDTLKPEIWPRDAQEAAGIITRIKQQREQSESKRARDSSSASKKQKSSNMSVVDQMSKDQLQELCHDLDAKIATVMNAIESKQGFDSAANDLQGMGLIQYQEPVPIQQDTPTFIQNQPTTMMKIDNGIISYPYPHQFDGSTSSGSSSSSTSPYVQFPPYYYVNPSLMQPVNYMNADHSLMGYYNPGLYYPVMQGSPFDQNQMMNASD